MNPSSTAKAVAAALAATQVMVSPSVWSEPEKKFVQPASAASSTIIVPTASAVTFVAATIEQQPPRATTGKEEVAGEIRSWALSQQNWDGEGASAPLPASLGAAVTFVRLLDPTSPMPETMLLASGNAALYWKSVDKYAELEFHAGKGISYFAELPDGRHKGMVKFDENEIPRLVKALLDF